MSKKTVVLLCAAPGTGKNSIARALENRLRACDGDVWVATDNEYGPAGYPPVARYLDSLRSGIGLDTPDFGKTFNRPNQMAYQNASRELAILTGCNVIQPGPYEDLYSEIQFGDEKLPLLEVMRQQYNDFNLFPVQVVLCPASYNLDSSPDPLLADDMTFMEPVKEEFILRIENRIQEATRRSHLEGLAQAALDRVKLEDPLGFAQNRLRKLLTTSKTFGTPCIWYPIDQSAVSAAERIMEALPLPE